MTKLEELKSAYHAAYDAYDDAYDAAYDAYAAYEAADHDADAARDAYQAELLMQKVPEGVFCKCGGRSVVFETWFSYFPCREHKHLNPVEYSRLPTETKETNK